MGIEWFKKKIIKALILFHRNNFIHSASSTLELNAIYNMFKSSVVLKILFYDLDEKPW
jgi:hypothetical protein